MWQGQRVSVVFPAYNEQDGIADAVADFQRVDAVDEVIVVDNNSRDATAERALEAGARVIKETRQGYGNALRRGMQEAIGEYVVLAEPDGTFIGKDVLKLLTYADDFDLVLGTRTTRELIWRGANMGWQLRWGNWIVAKLLQVLFDGPSLSDCGCTMRLIHQRVVQRMLPRLTVGGSHFLPEMVCLALLDGARIIEVPVNYRGRVGESKITGSLATAYRVGVRMIGLILRYRLLRR
jgi:glycosyltransferase involved in cell wall biosynthesis